MGRINSEPRSQAGVFRIDPDQKNTPRSFGAGWCRVTRVCSQRSMHMAAALVRAGYVTGDDINIKYKLTNSIRTPTDWN